MPVHVYIHFSWKLSKSPVVDKEHNHHHLYHFVCSIRFIRQTFIMT